MKRFLAALALLAALAAGFLPHTSDRVALLPACPTEDAAGPCYWDAVAQGNGQGRSFWVDIDEEVHFLP